LRRWKNFSGVPKKNWDSKNTLKMRKIPMQKINGTFKDSIDTAYGEIDTKNRATLERRYTKRYKFFRDKACETCGASYFSTDLRLVRKSTSTSPTSGIWTSSEKTILKAAKKCIVLCTKCAYKRKVENQNIVRYGNKYGHGSHSSYQKGCRCSLCMETYYKRLYKNKREVFILFMKSKEFKIADSIMEASNFLKSCKKKEIIRVTCMSNKPSEILTILQDKYNEKNFPTASENSV
jgi:hypothetical protein